MLNGKLPERRYRLDSLVEKYNGSLILTVIFQEQLFQIKNLHSLIEEVNDRLLNYLNSQPNIKTGQTLETQNLCRRYTLDNVALTAFGIHGRCFESDESDFMKLANSFIAPGSFALSMLQLFPLISSFISLK